MIRNQKGQITVELVLLAIVFSSISVFVSRYFQANEVLSQLVQSPWTNRMTGMIENGVWGPAESTRAVHPNNLSRHSSVRGQEL